MMDAGVVHHGVLIRDPKAADKLWSCSANTRGSVWCGRVRTAGKSGIES